MFHMSGFLCICGVGLLAGLHISTMMKFNPATFLKDLMRQKVGNMLNTDGILFKLQNIDQIYTECPINNYSIIIENQLEVR